jgi:hypothetical protein
MELKRTAIWDPNKIKFYERLKKLNLKLKRTGLYECVMEFIQSECDV